jgi:protein-disulfide isomerase
MKLSFVALFAGCLLLGSVAAHAQEKPLTSAEVEAIVKKVIADNPELIVKSLQAYEAKEHAETLSKATQNIKSSQDDLNHNPDSPSAGNPKGDVTVVEFFDYHCGYCKRFFPALAKLMDEDKQIRIVFKEFPILAEDSATASKAALAVNSIDKKKYLAYHSALMQSSGSFTLDMLTEEANKLGISKAAFEKALKNPGIEKELDHNKELAQALGISGTPVIIVGTQFIPGAVGLDTLKEKIAAARKEAKAGKS